jgi:hypothetical protein
VEYHIATLIPIILASVSGRLTLVIGAAGGAVLDHIGHTIYPELSSPIGFYAMMGAILKAPLAGLMALPAIVSREEAKIALSENPLWVIIEHEKTTKMCY